VSSCWACPGVLGALQQVGERLPTVPFLQDDLTCFSFSNNFVDVIVSDLARRLSAPES
jgi:hypothetical protein